MSITSDDIRFDIVKSFDNNRTASTGAYAKAYKNGSEIGHIEIIRAGDVYRVERFFVVYAERKTGIGRKLMELLASEVRQDGGTEIIVYPQPESYDESPGLESAVLYHIYQHLGFELVDCADIPKYACQKMIMRLERNSD